MGSFKKVCKTAGCNNLTDNKKGYCNDCQAKYLSNYKAKIIRENGTYKENRKSANERGYNYEWRKFAKEYLKKHKVCAICGKPAQVVDHKFMIAPIMLDVYGRFLLDESYYQPLCIKCNTRKAIEDNRQWEEYKAMRKRINSF